MPRSLLLLVLFACDPTVADTSSIDTDTDVVDTDDTDLPPVPFADLPAGEWSFVPIDGMVCGNGAGTGIGVYPGTDPTKLMVYYQGGGACWDTATCLVLKSAVYLESGVGEATVKADARVLDGLREGFPGAPLLDATWVFVPYCTGDLHAGNKLQAWDPLNPNRRIHHVGDENSRVVVERLQAELADAEQVWLHGSSAGGYGAQLQAHRYAQAWPEADLAVLADGSPMVTPYGGRFGVMSTAWDMALPDCETCTTDFTSVLEAQIARAPGARFGLITTEDDTVITLYFNYPLGGLKPATYRLADRTFAGDDRVQAFIATGDQHVLLGQAASKRSVDGVLLADWFTGWMDDSEAFTDAW